MTVSELMGLLAAYRPEARVFVSTLDKGAPGIGDNAAARLASRYTHTEIAGVSMVDKVVRLMPVAHDNPRGQAPRPYVSSTSDTLTAMQVGDEVVIPKPSTTVSGFMAKLGRKYPGRRYKTSRIDPKQTRVWRVA